MSGRPYDHEAEGGLRPTLVLVDELAAWKPEPWQEELLTRWDWPGLPEQDTPVGEAPPYIIITGGRKVSTLSRAWWWITWPEELRVRRGVLYLAAVAATWGVVDGLSRLIGAFA